ncbi:HNH endonuclease [Dongia deserti]|uniref:HNH endonuclease n=1 Tax=Dongia deserti TaxID=2268030 RepID=UPI00254854D3|nr:HNH endonuclease [Dongia deserti]
MAKDAAKQSSLGRAHSAGDHLKTAQVSDRLWILANEHGKLRLVGHFVITAAGLNQRQAAKLLGVPPSKLWEGKWHVLGDVPRETVGSLIDIHHLAEHLRFESKTATRLKLKDGRLDPQTLRSLRVLTPESAAHLREVWRAMIADRHKGRQSNPAWHRDELILALDFYLQHRAQMPAKGSDRVLDLSNTLNKLAIALGQRGDATYRNANGVYMKLMNFRSLDPGYTVEGRVGLTRIGQGDREVWRDYAGDPEKCRAAAAAIYKALEVDDADLSPGETLEVAEAEEGRLLTIVHQRRERSRKLVEAKKSSVLRERGKLCCEVCGFDFSVEFGERGRGFIECHHTKPVTSLTDGSKTKISDLALLCSNCHRMVHIKRPWLSLVELRKLLRDQKP